MGDVEGSVKLGRNCPVGGGGNYLGAIVLGGNCPGGLFREQLSRGQFSRGNCPVPHLYIHTHTCVPHAHYLNFVFFWKYREIYTSN